MFHTITLCIVTFNSVKCTHIYYDIDSVFTLQYKLYFCSFSVFFGVYSISVHFWGRIWLLALSRFRPCDRSVLQFLFDVELKAHCRVGAPQARIASPTSRIYFNPYLQEDLVSTATFDAWQPTNYVVLPSMDFLYTEADRLATRPT